MITNWRDAVAFVFYAALLPLIGVAVLSGTFWPLLVWGFVAMFGWVGKQAPQPVRHDLGLPARTLGHFDQVEDGAASLSAMMGLPYVGRERRRWRSQR
jgi:hypothetical protein